MKRTLKDYLLVFLKGIGMGAADVVPGVSGGTIAFITGIYEELIHSIKSIDLEAVRLFFKGKWTSLWKHINGNFLLSVFTGIALAIFSLARILEHFLESEPIMIWSFFFGLILISSLIVAKRIKEWNYTVAVALMGGVAIAFYITMVSPAETSDAPWFIILSGVFASCAMILPGISGSFILLLLGKYEFALEAVNTLDIMSIALLGIGAVIGLLSLSRVLSWLFKRFHDLTVAILAGFMLGSLNKIWPWKETIIQKNTLPSFSSSEDQLFGAILMIVIGIAIPLIFEFVIPKKKA